MAGTRGAGSVLGAAVALASVGGCGTVDREPPSAEPLRVSARPSDVFEVGQRIYAEIDTSQITVLH